MTMSFDVQLAGGSCSPARRRRPCRRRRPRPTEAATSAASPADAVLARTRRPETEACQVSPPSVGAERADAPVALERDDHVAVRLPERLAAQAVASGDDRFRPRLAAVRGGAHPHAVARAGESPIRHTAVPVVRALRPGVTCDPVLVVEVVAAPLRHGRGFFHVSPPSVERFASTARPVTLASMARPVASQTSCFGSYATDGSLIRAHVPAGVAKTVVPGRRPVRPRLAVVGRGRPARVVRAAVRETPGLEDPDD